MTQCSLARVGQTIMIIYSAALEGWCTGVFGPTLPELLCVYNTDLKTVSTIFFVVGLMNAFGSIFGCYILTKVKVYMMMSIATTVASIALCITPFVPSVYAACVTAGVAGLCVGILFNCRLLALDHIWHHTPFGVHLAMAGFPLGPVIASAVAAPFLTSSASNATLSADPNMRCTDPDTHVQYVFLILACLGVPVMISTFVSYLVFQKDEPLYTAAVPHFSCVYPSRRGYVLFLFVFFLLCNPAGGIFIVYGNLLTTFGVGGSLQIDVSQMALLTALFWGTFVSGRLSMSFVSTLFKQIKIIAFSYMWLFIAVTLLFVFGNTSFTCLAVSTGIFGLFCAPFSAFSFSWASEHIELTGFVIALGSVGEYTGAMLGPYIGGVLMGQFGADTFLYVILGIVVYQFLIFMIFYFVGTYYLERKPNERTLLIPPRDELED